MPQKCHTNEAEKHKHEFAVDAACDCGVMISEYVQELANALSACHSLAHAWAHYYATSPAYGIDGKVHPHHQAILDRALKALQKAGL